MIRAEPIQVELCSMHLMNGRGQWQGFSQTLSCVFKKTELEKVVECHVPELQLFRMFWSCRLLYSCSKKKNVSGYTVELYD